MPLEYLLDNHVLVSQRICSWHTAHANSMIYGEHLFLFAWGLSEELGGGLETEYLTKVSHPGVQCLCDQTTIKPLDAKA